MILVLKGADFSASNIGQIEMPRELSEFTKEFLTHYTKELTTLQTYAVDDLLNNLRVDGLWNKLHTICFPILANSMEEAFYDPKGSIASTKTAQYQLTSLGIRNNPSYFDGNTAAEIGNIVFTNEKKFDRQEGWFFGVVKTDTNSGNAPFGGNFESEYPLLYETIEGFWTGALSTSKVMHLTFRDANILKSTGLRLGQCQSTKDMTSVNIDNNVTFYEAKGLFADNIQTGTEGIAIARGTNSMNWSILSNGSGSNRLSNENNLVNTLGVFFLGRGNLLTKTEALKLDSYFDIFLKAFIS